MPDVSLSLHDKFIPSMSQGLKIAPPPDGMLIEGSCLEWLQRLHPQTLLQGTVSKSSKITWKRSKKNLCSCSLASEHTQLVKCVEKCHVFLLVARITCILRQVRLGTTLDHTLWKALTRLVDMAKFAGLVKDPNEGVRVGAVLVAVESWRSEAQMSLRKEAKAMTSQNSTGDVFHCFPSPIQAKRQ